MSDDLNCELDSGHLKRDRAYRNCQSAGIKASKTIHGLQSAYENNPLVEKPKVTLAFVAGIENPRYRTVKA